MLTISCEDISVAKSWRRNKKRGHLGRSVEAGKVSNNRGWNCLEIMTKPDEEASSMKVCSTKSHLAFIWK